MGLVVVAGWHWHIETLVQIHPDYTPMQHNTALGFILSGIGLLAYLYNHSHITLISGTLVIATGLLTLTEYLIDIDPGIDQLFMEHYLTTKSTFPGRMSPSTAITFILGGAALLSLCCFFSPKVKLMLGGLLSSIVAAIGIGILLGYLLGTDTPYDWSDISYMAIHTATGFTVFGSGVLLLAYNKATKISEQPPKWLALVSGIGVATIAISLWQVLLTQERHHINDIVTTQTDTLKSEIQKLVKQNVQALIRFGNRWEFSGGTPQNKWEDDAAHYIEHQPAYQAIEWVDPSYHVRWIQPLEGNEQAQHLELKFERRRWDALIKAREERKVTLSRSIDLVQGGKGFLAYKPLFPNNRFDGFMVAVFRLHTLLDILPHQENFSQEYVISLYEGDLIYRSQEASPLHDTAKSNTAQYDTEWGRETDITLYNITWRLRVDPTQKLLATVQSSIPEISLSLGLMIALLLTLTVNRFQTVRENIKTIKLTNKRLEGEITNRIKIENSLHEYKGHLEELIDERTAVLLETNTRLLNEISEHKSTGKTLQKSKAQLQAILDFAPALISIKNLEGNITLVNSRFEVLTEGSPVKFTGKNLFDLFPKDIANEMQKDDLLVEQTGKAIKTEETFVHKDGSIHTYLAIKFPLLNESDHVYSICSICTDITDQKLAQEALVKSEKNLQAIFDNALDGIFTIDGNGIIQTFNPSAERIFGYSAEKIIGKNVAILIHNIDTETHSRYIKNHIKSGNSRIVGAEQREVVALHSDGNTFPLELSVGNIKNDHHHMFIAITRDISLRTQTQEELNRSREQLRDLASHLESVREEDRKIIAREIHDELGQILTAISTDVHWIISHCPEDQYILEEKALSILPNVESAIQSVQRIVSELRPPILDDLGLESAVTWFCEQFQNRTGITCKPEINLDDSSISPEYSTAIFRILQESLTNVARHSGASTAVITLGTINNTINMEIVDDGKGIKNNEINAHNAFGLIGMRERALTFGGKIVIEKRNDQGTSVNLILPKCG